MPRIKDPLLVAAIDFGTTYSGYAIQFKHEYDKDPTEIRAPQPWNGGKQNLMSYKTPTCLLLDKNEEFVSFGFEAEEIYANLCLDGTNAEHYYFKQFKMRLQEGQGLKRDSHLEDETQKSMLAIKVFSMSIECLVKHLMKMLENEGTGVTMKEVLWVLTVPAIWDDTAKAFMKEAAEQAKIDDEHLVIALEPEAASLYCQYLPVEKFCTGDKTKFSDSKPGTVYLVADLGGGTADITIHEKLEDHKIKEIYKATGGPWGGTAVDSEFWQLFVSIAGGPVMGKFRRENKYDHLDLMKEIECVKRTFSVGMKTTFTIKFPASLNEICKDKKFHGCLFQDLVKESTHADSISFVGDKLRMTTELVAKLFSRVTDQITEHIGKLLRTTDAGKRVSMILMVGGFSESPYVQQQFKDRFQKRNLKILIPKDAGLSVVNGAVIFGRKPETITARVLRYTYGVEVAKDFVEEKDPAAKKIPGKNPLCKNVFSPFITESTLVARGHHIKKIYTTHKSYQRSMHVNIYTCSGDVPQFIDQCKYLGRLEVFIPNPSEEERNLTVVFIFGRTNLNILAIEEKEKSICATSLNLLD